MSKMNFKEKVRIKKRKATQEITAQEQLCKKKGFTCEQIFVPSDSLGTQFEKNGGSTC